MTGFGRGESGAGESFFAAEIKAVNHRYCEIQIRLPKSYASVEERLRIHLTQELVRGKIELSIKALSAPSRRAALHADSELAAEYYKLVRGLSQHLELPMDLGIAEIISLPGVITADEESVDADEAWALLQGPVDEALDRLVAMRKSEGARLAADFASRIDKMESFRQKLAGYAEGVAEHYSKRLLVRIEDLTGTPPVDEARLAQEVAILADKASVDEELVRLESHFTQFRELVKSDGSVGRQLDFLCQEMNREVNTIGSKAGNIDMTRLVVEMKGELEKLREQVQNIR